MALKDRLTELRKARGLSQVRLSEILNVGTGTIGGYENGSRIPRKETLYALADFFGVTPEYLLYGEQLTMKQFDALYQQIKEELFYLNAEELEAMDINRSAIVLMYKARRPIRMDRARDLAEAFHINLDAILNNPEYATDDPAENDPQEIELLAAYRSFDASTRALLLDYARFLQARGK